MTPARRGPRVPVRGPGAGLRPLVAVLVLAGLAAVLLGSGGCAPSAGPADARAADSTLDTTAAPSAPVRVRIATIDVDASVVPLGTATDLTQEVPDDPMVVGWWEPGARPGQAGSVPLVGHTSSSGTAVFDELHTLTPGDVVEIESTVGAHRYRVEQVDELPVEAFDTVAADVYRTTGPPALVLMTCGDWDGDRFASTVVVRAVPV